MKTGALKFLIDTLDMQQPEIQRDLTKMIRANFTFPLCNVTVNEIDFTELDFTNMNYETEIKIGTANFNSRWSADNEGISEDGDDPFHQGDVWGTVAFYYRGYDGIIAVVETYDVTNDLFYDEEGNYLI